MAIDDLDPGTQDLLQQRPPLTTRERQARYAGNRKKQGYKQHNLWLMPGELPAVRRCIKQLRRGSWRALLLRWLLTLPA